MPPPRFITTARDRYNEVVGTAGALADDAAAASRQVQRTGFAIETTADRISTLAIGLTVVCMVALAISILALLKVSDGPA